MQDKSDDFNADQLAPNLCYYCTEFWFSFTYLWKLDITTIIYYFIVLIFV